MLVFLKVATYIKNLKMENKHTSMDITFSVTFSKALSDDEVTGIMRELDFDIDHPLVSDVILRKLSK